MNAPFVPMSAGQLGARTVFEVKCRFAIDAIADVYRAEPPRFENGSMRKRIRDFGRAIHHRPR